MGYNHETGLYTEKDIAFVNTSELVEVGRYFMKNGVYTKAPKGSKDWKDFWDREEERRFKGMTLPGKLFTNEKGETEIQKVHIPGQLYGFLNYAQIKRTIRNDDDIEDIKDVVKMTSREAKAATKVLTFPDFWDGHYHFITAKGYARRLGKHFIGVKSRRKGFSYLEGWDCADSCNLIPNSASYVCAYEMKYLTGAKRIMNFILSYIEFLESHTIWRRGMIKRDISEYIKLGYIPQGSKIHKGYQSLILPMTAKDNPDVARGLDGEVIKIEEGQTFPNLLEFIDAALPVLEDGDYITGQMSLWGTAGDKSKDSNWAPFQEIYYNPKARGFMGFQNIWDEGMSGDIDGCGYCFPYYRNLTPYMDENGNSNLEVAKAVALTRREARQKVAKSTKDIESYIAERCFNGKEAFSLASNNIFPPTTDQLFFVENGPLVKNIKRHGLIERRPEGMKFIDKPIGNGEGHVIPVENYPLKKGVRADGCLTLWQMPYSNSLGVIPDRLYRLWVDPYGISKDAKNFDPTNSLGVCYIYERHNTFTPTYGDIIIGVYIGRPEEESDFNENVLRIAEWCNGIIQFENDRGDLKGYAKKTNRTRFLAVEPNFRWDKQFQGGKSGGRGFGISMSDIKRKATAAIKLKEWLNTKRSYDTVKDRELTNLDLFYCPLGLRQLPKWNPKGNFDTTSALLVGMFDIEETMNDIIEEAVEADEDNFWNRPLFQ